MPITIRAISIHQEIVYFYGQMSPAPPLSLDVKSSGILGEIDPGGHVRIDGLSWFFVVCCLQLLSYVTNQISAHSFICDDWIMWLCSRWTIAGRSIDVWPSICGISNKKGFQHLSGKNKYICIYIVFPRKLLKTCISMFIIRFLYVSIRLWGLLCRKKSTK